jgi:hypothetical protein
MPPVFLQDDFVPDNLECLVQEGSSSPKPDQFSGKKNFSRTASLLAFRNISYVRGDDASVRDAELIDASSRAASLSYSVIRSSGETAVE